ncbi:unnamed protein product [marine sediment metagenome]|uniref:Uncharacterized protein n=1 Tax=marine sediment metagenome TaxID=412755 RepID=X1LCZ2_9ZZZZ
MSYVIMEESEIRREAPEFQYSLKELEDRVLANTLRLWPGYTYGHTMPGAKQFGQTTWLPYLFADENADILDSRHEPDFWGRNSFRQLFTPTSPTPAAIPGWRTILQGGNPTAIGTMPKDFRGALAGFAFGSKAICVTKLKMQIGKEKIPMFNIEEIRNYNKPVLILKKGYEIEEETGFELRGYFEGPGYQRIIPKGFVFYRRIDLVLHE